MVRSKKKPTTKSTTRTKRATKPAAKAATAYAKTTAKSKPAAKAKTVTHVRTNASTKHYTVWDGTRGGKTFKTSGEAVAYSNDILRKSGDIVAITATNKQVTHR